MKQIKKGFVHFNYIDNIGKYSYKFSNSQYSTIFSFKYMKEINYESHKENKIILNCLKNHKVL